MTRLVSHALGAASCSFLLLAAPVRAQPAGLVLESPFSSVADMAKRAFPFLPVGLLLTTRYETARKIAKVSCPVLVIHGDEDEVIPFDQGIKVYEAAPQPTIARRSSVFRICSVRSTPAWPNAPSPQM